MRKSIKLLSLLTALLVFMGLQSCTKHKKGEILNYVPADASVIVYGDLNYVLEKSGIAEDGKIGEPLKSILDQENVDVSEYKKELALLKSFTREAAVFINGEKTWILLSLNNSDDIIDYMKKEEGADADKEDGVTVLTYKHQKAMFKDDVMFLCLDQSSDEFVAQVSKVNDLCDLGDESFGKNEQTEALVQNIKDEDLSLFFVANLGKISAIVNDREFDQFKAGLSMIYNNPTYLSGTLKINDEGISAVMSILDSKYALSKCSIPLGQIDTKVLSYAAVPGNTITYAVDLPTTLINKILGISQKAFPSEVLSLIKCINGTAAATINLAANSKEDMFAVALTANNNSDAVQLGSFIQQLFDPVKCSTSDKYLRVMQPGGCSPSGSTSYANILQGKPGGIAVDLAGLAKSFGLAGDFANVGTFVIYSDTPEGSLVVKSEWKCANPVQRIFDVIKNADAIENALESIEDKFVSSPSAPLDLPGYEDEFVEEEDFSEYALPAEPDYIY